MDLSVALSGIRRYFDKGLTVSARRKFCRRGRRAGRHTYRRRCTDPSQSILSPPIEQANRHLDSYGGRFDINAAAESVHPQTIPETEAQLPSTGSVAELL
jgi:hypothetical protein